MPWLALLIALAGCGRIGFDPFGRNGLGDDDGNGSGHVDGGPSGITSGATETYIKASNAGVIPGT